MKTAMVSILVLLVGHGLALANPRVPTVDQLLRSQGELAFSDGASIYRLFKDHTFKLQPVGMSGRTIEGTWKRKDAFFVITGKWGWINGLSARNDFRRMTLHVNVTSGTPVTAPRLRVGPKVRVYPVYFTIEELVKTTQRAYKKAAAAARPKKR